MNGPWFRRSALVLALCAPGCETLPPQDGPAAAAGAARLERWACGDYFDGCGFARCPVTLTADADNGTGTVEFAGTVEAARFEIRGLQRRWDWCLQDDGDYGCAFVVDTDGRGRYYDFTVAPPDPDGTARAKPSELFKCRKRRSIGS